MKYVIRYTDGTRAILDTKKDSEITSDWVRDATAYTDMYMHLTMKGKKIVYLVFWSRYEGVSPRVSINSDEIAEWIQDNIDVFDSAKIEKLKGAIYYKWFKETA